MTASTFRRSLCFAVLLLVTGIAAGAITTSAAAACPDSELLFNKPLPTPSSPFTVNAAVFDTVYSPGEELSFNLVTGTLSVAHERKFSASVRARDTFTLTGVAPGTPVPVMLRFDVDGTIGTFGCGGSNCWGYVGGSLLSGADQASGLAQENMFSGSPRPVHFTVTLPLVFVGGVSREIEIGLSGYGSNDHFETATGRYSFDLPAGVAITSCWGYAATPTPARASSWGRLKAGYR